MDTDDVISTGRIKKPQYEYSVNILEVRGEAKTLMADVDLWFSKTSYVDQGTQNARFKDVLSRLCGLLGKLAAPTPIQCDRCEMVCGDYQGYARHRASKHPTAPKIPYPYAQFKGYDD